MCTVKRKPRSYKVMLRRLFTGNARGKADEIDVAQVVAARDAGNVQIVDVRELNEWNRGHIHGSIHIPLGDLATRHTEVTQGIQVVTVCQSGRRSLDAVQRLAPVGFTNAVSLAGGIQAWRDAQQPIER